MLEVFEIAQIPGGGPTRVVGTQAVRRVVDEMKLTDPVDRAPRRAEPAPPVDESREQRVRRIQRKIFGDLGYEDEGLALGVELDPEYFERYAQVYWGFFEGRETHLDPITRQFVAVVIYAFKNMGEDVYQHVRKALRLGATMHQLLECFQVCVAPGGLATLHVGLRALARARRDGLS
jgi:alkylhydroperoxidase/carboxymuconolactone decarboxylase family protein YurZ